jgi:hypothetical protein
MSKKASTFSFFMSRTTLGANLTLFGVGKKEKPN